MEKENKPVKTQEKWLKVSQFLTAYLVSAWTFLEFVDWALDRYSISPHWVDLLLWLLIGIIPSLLIYLSNQNRINQKGLKRREKIIFPINAVLVLVVLYFSFGSSDLGATTQNIDYTTEQGKNKSALITKEEFRTGFIIYDFEPKTSDSTYTWMISGIKTLLHQDLSQNKNLSPILENLENTVDKVNLTMPFFDYYIDGEFEVQQNTYVITTFIRSSKSAKVIIKETFRGEDLLSLIDEITVFITKNFTTTKSRKPNYIDLDIKEFASNSLKAIEHYTSGDYENAIKEDSTFALAYLASAKKALNYSISKLEEQWLSDKAYHYRGKLPAQKQGETLILKNLAYDQFENAEELVKLQLQIDPNDPAYNHILYNVYGRAKKLEEYTEHARNIFENNTTPLSSFYYVDANLIEQEYDDIIDEIDMLELMLPNDNDIFSFKIIPQLLNSDIEAATETQNKIKLTHPDWENLTKVYDKALSYLKDHKVTKQALQKFVGEYRSDKSEQMMVNWINESALLTYVSNQRIKSMVLAGETTLIEGHTIAGITFEYSFLKSSNNSFYGMKLEQNTISNTATSWYWKVDDSIKKAEALLEAQKFDDAKNAYKKAIKDNPKHYYLEDALTHINYIQSIDSTSLMKQYQEVEGTYGPRKIWIEDGKLFYKEVIDTHSSLVQLLPISKNRYINLTRLRDNIEFEHKNNKTISSFLWQFNNEKMEWVSLKNVSKYPIKN